MFKCPLLKKTCKWKGPVQGKIIHNIQNETHITHMIKHVRDEKQMKEHMNERKNECNEW